VPIRVLICLTVGVALAFSVAAHPQRGSAEEAAHTVIAADAIEWKAAPPSLPAGAQAAVLYGDPAKEGLFAMRLKLPKGYHIPPHTHPKPEVVTVISGTARLGTTSDATPN
jgi:quercetin dioxygenase-like cupin family protein